MHAKSFQNIFLSLLVHSINRDNIEELRDYTLGNLRFRLMS